MININKGYVIDQVMIKFILIDEYDLRQSEAFQILNYFQKFIDLINDIKYDYPFLYEHRLIRDILGECGDDITKKKDFSPRRSNWNRKIHSITFSKKRYIKDKIQ